MLYLKTLSSVMITRTWFYIVFRNPNSVTIIKTGCTKYNSHLYAVASA